MYKDAIEAFERTICELDAKNPNVSSYAITRLTGPDVRLQNGISHCYVEVTSSDGLQFGIEAFDEEAHKLYRIALRVKDGGRAAISPLLVSA